MFRTEAVQLKRSIALSKAEQVDTIKVISDDGGVVGHGLRLAL